VDPYRLPRHVVPTRYELRLEPDLNTATFTGSAVITLEIREATSEIVLNAVELSVTAAVITGQRGETSRGSASLDEQLERCRLSFATALSPGTWRLRLDFHGILNDKLRGFYRSTYKDPAGATRTLAATQFEATDARRAFPCWDEPSFKAVFACTLVIDPALAAVSNTRVTSEHVERGKKVVSFAETIRMSTYLVAFVVGELGGTEPTHVGRTPVRVWCVPGKRRLAGFGLEAAAASLEFFERYYGLPYPGDKLDLLAIPDFAAGAMENFGAITFRETALLVDEREATHNELERVADVVAHENAHMWFGDLVTMSWWNGIWLNEAFATFMEMLAVDAWKPEWKRWNTFGVSRTAAFTVDSLWSTRPIEYEVRAPRDADAMFDVLTYEKGASVLRMLEQYLGEGGFRTGVREYLRAHALANADTGDLWAALGRVSGVDIPGVMDAWIFKPGFPLVSARRDGAHLVLSQQRFTALPEPPPFIAPAQGKDQRWQVPVQLRFGTPGGTVREQVLLTDGEMRIALPPHFQWALVNAGGHGFYRVRYAGELREALLPRLDTLAPIERFNLVGDAWAAATAGLLPPTEYLELAVRFSGERDRNVWTILLASLGSLNRVVRAADRPRLEAFARALLVPVVTDLGWAPRTGEDDLTRQLRGDVLRAMGTLGDDPATQTRAAELYADWLREPTAVDANVLPALIAILAYTGGSHRYTEFLQAFRTADTPQEEQRYLYALVGFREPELITRTLERTINGEIRTQDGPFVVRAALMSVHGRELAWGFVKERWEHMDRIFPKHGLRRMCEGVIGLATPELERDVHAFFTERKIHLGGRILEQYLEQLRVAVQLGEQEGATLARYLARFS
jgi:puromycin-sensitive aminopeptidase